MVDFEIWHFVTNNRTLKPTNKRNEKKNDVYGLAVAGGYGSVWANV